MMADSPVDSLCDCERVNGHTRDVVLVTGFEPFSVHKVNASWEAVRELQLLSLPAPYELIIKELPVDYESVDKKIPELWKEFKPKLMVHCGVSGIAKDVTLEQCAHRYGYEAKDNNKRIPQNNCCPCTGPECLESKIQMDLVSAAVNNSSCGVNAVKSDDAGRYLCDYTYYTSLSISRSNTAFIHVPPLDKPYSAKELATGIRFAILNMLKQIEDEERNNNQQNVIST